MIVRSVNNSLRSFAGGAPAHGWMLHCMPSRYIPCVACVPIRVQGRRAVAVLREASRPNRLFYSHRSRDAGWSSRLASKPRRSFLWGLCAGIVHGGENVGDLITVRLRGSTIQMQGLSTVHLRSAPPLSLCRGRLEARRGIHRRCSVPSSLLPFEVHCDRSVCADLSS